MKIDCGCYVDSTGHKYAVCPDHNGNTAKSISEMVMANREKTARSKAACDARREFKEQSFIDNGSTRKQGVSEL